MSIRPAKCPNCGAKIMVETNKDARVCPVCNQPFFTEEAITALRTEDAILPDYYEPMVSVDIEEEVDTDQLAGKKYSKLPKVIRDELKQEFRDCYCGKRNKVLIAMLVSGILGLMLLLMAIVTGITGAWVLMAVAWLVLGVMIYIWFTKFNKNASKVYLNWLAEKKNIVIER